MRIIPFAISTVLAAALVIALNSKMGALPPVGKLLSPTHGLWQNAEPTDASFSMDLNTGKLQNKVEVYLDERLVPHVFAQNDHDAYFVQGYIHARFRLFQMEFQTHAAAGRLSEILGEKVGENSVLERHDRRFRRMGMVYAAENAVKEMAKSPKTQAAVDAYTEGGKLLHLQVGPGAIPH